MSDYHHEEHHQQQYRQEDHHHNMDADNYNKAPSAPHQSNNGDDNGFYVIDDKSKSDTQQILTDVDQLVSEVADAVNSGKEINFSNSTNSREDVSKILDELNESQRKLSHVNDNIVTAEADSTIAAATKPVFDNGFSGSFNSQQTKDHQHNPVLDVHLKKQEKSGGDCHFLGSVCEHFKNIQIPKEVEDYVLWKNPKMTGALLGGTLVLLISLACFSFLSVVSTAAMLALIATGAYKFYLAVMFRIKGTHDETFEKFHKLDVQIPKEKVQELSRILETDINQTLVQTKNILLWENVWVSGIALFALYCVNWIGSVFNLITLVILVTVSIFTLPKVYQVYKKPINMALNKTSGLVEQVYGQVQEKVPFLKKKTIKTQ